MSVTSGNLQKDIWCIRFGNYSFHVLGSPKCALNHSLQHAPSVDAIQSNVHNVLGLMLQA